MSRLKRLKRWVRVMLGQDFFPRIDAKVRYEWLGTPYGGWNVMLDGLDRSAVVYSFGVGEDASFDLELIRRLGVTVHAFDPTPRSIQWVRQQRLPPQFVLHEYGLADFDGIARFVAPRDPNHVSHRMSDDHSEGESIRVSVKRLETILSELGHVDIDLLKVDIEGAEYAFIDDLVTGQIRPTQLLVEFHHRFPTVGVARTRRAVGRLRELGYRLFSVSDSGEEYGFIR